MEMFKDSLPILIAAPIYLILIATESAVSIIYERHYYSLRGTLANVQLVAVNVALDLAVRSGWFAVLLWIFDYRIVEIASPWLYWATLLIVQDFLFYFLHRVDHACRLFWAVHVTHHSSGEFNLTVGFRPSVLQPLYRFAWFLPLAVLGYEPGDVLLMYSLTQLYGVLVHTRCVGKLAFLEWFLCIPSHHRVHHGINSQYLDKNLGMVFIVWNRLFGTFAEEKEPVRFGPRGGEPTRHLGRVIFCEFRAIGKDLGKSASIRTKLRCVFGPPGRSHETSIAP